MKQKRFVDKGLKAHKLYAQTPLFKAILLVAIPGLLISLMSGIYVFADQLLLSILVPQDPRHDVVQIYIDKYHIAQADIDRIKTVLLPAINYSFADTATIVKSAVAVTLPIMVVINAVPNIAAIGAGSMYGQCIARNNKQKALQIWKSTFYCAICIGLLSSIIFYSVNDTILRLIADKSSLPDKIPSEFSQDDINLLNAYFHAANELQIAWSHEFLDILSWSSILNVFILYFSFMVRAEGKLAFVTMAEMGCNAVNILFDYIYIKYCHSGMRGGGLATLTGWSINVIVYALYIAYLGKKGQTWMRYKDLLPRNGSPMSFSILVPIVVIGLSVFLRNFTNAIANSTFLAMLGSAAKHSGRDSQYWQSLSGIVWPVGSLFFYAIFGIADGVRTLVAYNYARSQYTRIRKAYWYATLLSFIYGIVVYACLASFLGDWLIKLFPLDNTSIDIYTDAIKYMRIQVLFIPMVALSIGGLLMFQATNQMAMANFIAVLQACLVFPIASGTMYGVTVNITHNPLHFVITNPLNTGTAGLIITIISIVYLYKYLGHTRFNAKINTNGKTISARFVVPTNYKRLSYAERQLNKSIASSNITSFKKTYHKRFKLTVCCSNKFRKIRFTTKIESR